MSLDVYLRVSGSVNKPEGVIYIRENGQNREISREEWDSRFPGREPVVCCTEFFTDIVYSRNITHNLGEMAREAGVYEYLWQPEKVNIIYATDLVRPLTRGLELLRSDPERFKKFNPKNGWGDYEGLVNFVQDYLNACEKYPNATIEVSR